MEININEKGKQINLEECKLLSLAKLILIQLNLTIHMLKKHLDYKMGFNEIIRKNKVQHHLILLIFLLNNQTTFFFLNYPTYQMIDISSHHLPKLSYKPLVSLIYQ